MRRCLPPFFAVLILITFVLPFSASCGGDDDDDNDDDDVVYDDDVGDDDSSGDDDVADDDTTPDDDDDSSGDDDTSDDDIGDDDALDDDTSDDDTSDDDTLDDDDTVDDDDDTTIGIVGEEVVACPAEDLFAADQGDWVDPAAAPESQARPIQELDFYCGHDGVSYYGGAVVRQYVEGPSGGDGAPIAYNPKDGKIYVAAAAGHDLILRSRPADAPPNTPWESFVVDCEVEYPDMAIDEDGYFHFTYHDLGRDNLVYATNRGGTWRKELVWDLIHYEGMAIAVDTKGNPHIAHSDFYRNHERALYSFRDQDQWVTEILMEQHYDYYYDTNGKKQSFMLYPGDYPDIEVDRLGRVHYIQSESNFYRGRRMFYHLKQGSQWSEPYAVESLGPVTTREEIQAKGGYNVNLAKGPDGSVFVLDWDPDALYIARVVGKQLQKLPIAAATNTLDPFFALDSHHGLHLIADQVYRHGQCGNWQDVDIGEFPLLSSRVMATADVGNGAGRAYVVGFDNIEGTNHPATVSMQWINLGSEPIVETVGEVGRRRPLGALAVGPWTHLVFKKSGGLFHDRFFDGEFVDRQVLGSDPDNGARDSALTGFVADSEGRLYLSIEAYESSAAPHEAYLAVYEDGVWTIKALDFEGIGVEPRTPLALAVTPRDEVVGVMLADVESVGSDRLMLVEHLQGDWDTDILSAKDHEGAPAIAVRDDGVIWVASAWSQNVSLYKKEDALWSLVNEVQVRDSYLSCSEWLCTYGVDPWRSLTMDSEGRTYLSTYYSIATEEGGVWSEWENEVLFQPFLMIDSHNKVVIGSLNSDTYYNSDAPITVAEWDGASLNVLGEDPNARTTPKPHFVIDGNDDVQVFYADGGGIYHMSVER